MDRLPPVLVKGVMSVDRCGVCGADSHSGCKKYDGISFSQCPEPKHGGR